MAIQIERFGYAGDQAYPVVRCDHCTHRIEDYMDGIVVFPDREVLREGMLPYLIAHKGECDERVQRRLDGWNENVKSAQGASWELKHFLIRLCVGVGLSWDEARGDFEAEWQARSETEESGPQ